MFGAKKTVPVPKESRTTERTYEGKLGNSGKYAVTITTKDGVKRITVFTWSSEGQYTERLHDWPMSAASELVDALSAIMDAETSGKQEGA